MNPTTSQSQSRIIRATDPIPVDHPLFLLIGQPGIGKTSLAYSCEAPILLDFDNGAYRAANRKDTWPITCWADVALLLEQPEILDPYKTVVLDTVGRCLDLLTADIAETEPKKAPGGNLSQQGWGTLKSRFRSFSNRLRTMGKDLLLVAHDKEDKDGDTRITRADVAGGSYSELMKIADFVGYLYMSGKDRCLDFNPTDKWIGKNPGGWAPFRVPSVGKAQTFMAERFAEGKKVLGKIGEASAIVANSVIDWRAQIETFTTAEEFNKAIPAIKGLSAILLPQVTQILLARAEAIGIPFDKEARQFTQPAPSMANSLFAGVL